MLSKGMMTNQIIIMEDKKQQQEIKFE